MLSFTTANQSWLLLIVLLGVGLLLAKVTERPRIPDVAAYLVAGIVLGPQVLGVIHESAATQMNQWMLMFGAAMILFDGGRHVALAILRKTWLTVVLLATLGVLLTAGTMAVVAHLIFGGSLLLALLLGSVVASTDPATLIPVFRRIPVIARVQQTLEAESAFNDATAAVLFSTLVYGASGHVITWTSVVSSFVFSAGIGVFSGIVVAGLGLMLISYTRYGVLREYSSVVLLMVAMVSYQMASVLQGSGFMAAFVAGIVIGNAKPLQVPIEALTEQHAEHFFHAITLIFRMIIFILLGTQVQFQDMMQNFGGLLLLVVVLMLVARPITVFVCVTLDRKAKFTWPERFFMSWVRETGVLPAALSGILLVQHVPWSHRIAAVTFLAILLTIVIQATSMPWVADKLSLTVSEVEEDI